jgi:hypothetical protein
MAVTGNACRILVGETEGEIPLGTLGVGARNIFFFTFF